MDWFERITGFRELDYEGTQARLWVENGRLRTAHTDRQYAIGRLETPTLGELRSRVAKLQVPGSRTSVSCIEGDARQLHAQAENGGALFQVASQFNLLEMVNPSVTPEHGVTGYVRDPTQGPACAVAAGAGTIYRNYLVEVAGRPGQRADRQIDCLADLGAALGNKDGALWTMRNGYAQCTETGLATVDAILRHATSQRLDEFRSLLRIGLHLGVQVTDVEDPAQLVSQAYCSALPMAHTGVPRQKWHRFASLVLEASYEATLLAGVLNAHHAGSNKVLLTRVGGGAFGNDHAWINAAIGRAVDVVGDRGLDIRIVCHGRIPEDLQQLTARFAQ